MEGKDGSGVGQIVVCVIRMDVVRQMGNNGWRVEGSAIANNLKRAWDEIF
jgi:hypothetical protein